MSFGKEIDAFIRDFVNDLNEDNVAIFAGAGMSKAAGYVDWPELLRDIADELGLKIELEHDLISVAQFHVNQLKGSAKLAKKILQEFSEQAEPSVTHEILARLPIRTFWTTNYDTLIEDSLKKAYKVPDVKHSVDQLNNTRPKRDAVVYKMHGDASLPSKSVLYKEQYERYHQTHELFITALSGDLVSKTFLFIGFSFTDPNLDYVLSRLHTATRRNHYCFMKREVGLPTDDDETKRYKQRKQELRVDDLKRFGIQALLLDDYSQIPAILEAIEARFLKRTIFISGSAEEYGAWDRQEALGFIHTLSANLIRHNYRLVNGFGWGIGSAVLNGALEAVYKNPEKYSEDQIVMRPFPQYASSHQDLQRLWEEYRQRMISLAGIVIVVFGNKMDKSGTVVEAGGVIREWEIAAEKGRIVLPVGATGYAAKTIMDRIIEDPGKYCGGKDWLVESLKEMSEKPAKQSDLVSKIVDVVQKLGR